MKQKKALVLVELLTVVIIITVVAIFFSKVIYTVVENSRVGRAKAQIARLAALLEMVKDDTGYYPVSLSHCTQADPPPGISKRWKGPYCNSIPLDPWKTAYFYIIPPTAIFDVPPIIRGAAKPQEYTISFEVVNNGLPGKIRIENYGVASSTLDINGIPVFNQSDFKNLPSNKQPQIIQKEIMLQEGTNEMTASLGSAPQSYYIVYLSGCFPTDKYFILGSYGKNGVAGGAGFNIDIQWHSDLYPNFQPVILE